MYYKVRRELKFTRYIHYTCIYNYILIFSKSMPLHNFSLATLETIGSFDH